MEKKLQKTSMKIMYGKYFKNGEEKISSQTAEATLQKLLSTNMRNDDEIRKLLN